MRTRLVMIAGGILALVIVIGAVEFRDGELNLTGGARAGRAIVLALPGDAEALLLVGTNGGIGFGLRQRGGRGHRRKSGRDGGSEDERADNVSCRHDFLQKWVFVAPSVGRTS